MLRDLFLKYITAVNAKPKGINPGYPASAATPPNTQEDIPHTSTLWISAELRLHIWNPSGELGFSRVKTRSRSFKISSSGVRGSVRITFHLSLTFDVCLKQHLPIVFGRLWCRPYLLRGRKLLGRCGFPASYRLAPRCANGAFWFCNTL